MTNRVPPAAIAAAFFAATLAGMLAVTLTAPLNHDEHQFIAAGALLAREGLIPARDYPWFHTPNLAGVYAALFSVSDHLLLSARLFSTFMAWLGAIGLFAFTFSRLNGETPRARTFWALSIAALFAFNPVIVYTFPKAWNHTLPALLLLGAFASHCRGADTGHQRWFFLGGLCVALAAGTRISFAPLALPFLLLAAVGAGHARRTRGVLLCAGGLTIGALPTLALLAAAPAAFLFDNFGYNSTVNALYRVASGDLRSPWGAKAFFVLKVLINPGNLVLFLACLGLLWPLRRAWRTHYPLGLLLAITPFVLLGVLAPTPSYSQYYSAAAVVAALGVSIGLAARTAPRSPALAAVLGAAVLICLAASAAQNPAAFGAFRSAEWVPIRVHAEGRQLRERLAPDLRAPVLTLAPIIPLEGGLRIYEGFATGSFAWRTAGLLDPERRHRFGFVSAEELPALLDRQPPGALLLRCDRKREKEIVALAKSRGYQRTLLPDGRELWLPLGVHP